MLSRLTSYVEEIIGDQQSTNNHILCICQILEKMGIERSTTSAIYRLQEIL
jgi:hypothetical protein